MPEPSPRDAAAPHPPACPPSSSALTQAPIVAHVVRSGFVESVHHGTVVVTTPDGSIDWAIGDPTGPVLARSSNKPIQALAMVRAGLDLPPTLLALACSSHSGEPFHLEGVRAILAGAGLTESDLQNTPGYPIDEAEHDAWIRASRPKSPLGQNCSGKHSAMLATCVAAGWDTATYRDPQHPLQRAITATIEELSGEPVVAVAVDGCGAPLHAYALTGLARAFGRLAAASAGTPGMPGMAGRAGTAGTAGTAGARVADAMRREPAYLGGTLRQVTALVRGAPGVIAKDGAEAVYAVGLPDGRGVAVKIADGYPRAAPVVLAAALRRAGLDAPEAIAILEAAPVLGHGEPVGAILAVGVEA